MQNDNDIAKYISNEKEISQFKIYMLERGSLTPARKRLVEIEKEFVELPLESMDFSTIKEVEDAIELYKKSRRSFHEKHTNVDFSKLVSKKITYLEQVARDFMSKKVISANPVQDKIIFENLADHISTRKKEDIDDVREELSLKSIASIKKLQPSTLQKQNARYQVAIYSLGKSIESFVDSIRLSEDDIKDVNSSIDKFVQNIELSIFDYYNESIDSVMSVVKSTFGDNKYIQKVYDLENIFDMYPCARACVHAVGTGAELGFETPRLGNLYLGYKNTLYHSYSKDLAKKTKNKVFGIVFPIERTSREKMTLLSKNLSYKGLDVSELFSDSLSNVQVLEGEDKTYYKGIFLRPMWSLLNSAANDMQHHWFVSKITGEALDDISKFDDKEYIKMINSKSYDFFDIDTSSKILIPRTRSEEHYFSEVSKMMRFHTEEIKSVFESI